MGDIVDSGRLPAEGEHDEDAVLAPRPPRVHQRRPGLPDLDDPQFPDIDGLELEGDRIDLPDARIITILRSSVTGCTINAPEARLDAQDAELTDLDLTGVNVEALTRVHVLRCRLGGADAGDARLLDVTFEDCVLDLASFRTATLERVRVEGGRADQLDLSGSRLTDVAFVGVPVAPIELDGARLTRVDVTDADLRGVENLETLRGVVITATQAVELAPRLARAAGFTVRRPPA